jgi:hypothetical protein
LRDGSDAGNPTSVDGALVADVGVAGGSFAAGFCAPRQSVAQRARIKDVATIEGIRDNQLVGYGLVVGLHGPGTARRLCFRLKR